MNDIKPADMEGYQAKRISEGKAAGTIDHEIGKTKTMVFKAFDNDLVGADAIKAFKKVKKVLKLGADIRTRILSQREYQNIFNNLPVHLKPIFATAYYTGMRRGEILNLKWDNLDLKNRMIRLEASSTKDNESRVIPICTDLYVTFKKIPRAIHDEHVFLYHGKPIRDIRTGLKKACEKAEVHYGRFIKNGFVFHDLRHTFNTNMRKSGVPESVIMEITGHSTREMFDRYNTIDEEDVAKAADRFQNFLVGSVNRQSESF